MTKKKGDEEPRFKRRYLISFFGFLTYFLMNMHRMNMSVAIVAMVNSPTHENKSFPHASNPADQTYPNSSQNQAQNAMKYDWSPQMEGYILGAGFFGFVLSLMIGGKLTERFAPRMMLISGTFVSSFTTLITPLAPLVNVYLLIFIQSARGIAQGFMLPSATVLSANWYPKAERGFLGGIALTGYQVGRLLGGILTGLICDSISIGGWPSVFYICGGLGIFISLFEYFTVYNLPKDDPRISRAELDYILANQENVLTLKKPSTPWRKILTSLSTYALVIGISGQYWGAVYYLSSHAIFLADVLKYPITQNGLIMSGPYIISMVIIPGTSYLSSWLNEKKYLNVDKVRKMWFFLGSFGYSICLIVIIATKCEKVVATVFSVLGTVFVSINTAAVMIVPVDMSPTFSGSLMALSATIGSFVGFLVPVVCGALTDEEQSVEQWTKFFIICIAIALSSAIFFVLFGSAEVQSYNYSSNDSPKNPRKGSTAPVEMKDRIEKES